MKVGIIGSSATTRDLAPYGDPSWEWWSMNNVFTMLPQAPWTRIFEIHDIDYREGRWFRKDRTTLSGIPIDDYIKQLSELPIRVYMQRHWPEIPNSVEFPINKLLSSFRRYFRSSVSYMIAFAMLEGATTIGLWGIDLSSTDEYARQRPCTEYFLGLAEGRGINVVIPDEADLLKVRTLYAYEDIKESIYTRKIRSLIEVLQKDLAKITKDKELAARSESELLGGIQALDRVLRVWQ